MSSLAEEVIEINPDKFNCYREFSRHYDISEAHQTLRSLCILDEEFQFNAPINSKHQHPPGQCPGHLNF